MVKKKPNGVSPGLLNLDINIIELFVLSGPSLQITALRYNMLSFGPREVQGGLYRVDVL